MPPKEITELKDAIRATHGCESLHVESVPVKEVFEGQAAWEGKVEVFDLVGHRQAKRAYAWSYRDGNQKQGSRCTWNSASRFAGERRQSRTRKQSTVKLV